MLLSNSALFCLHSIKPSDCEEDVIKGVVIGILVVVEDVMDPLPAFYNDVALMIEEEVVMRHLSDIPNAFSEPDGPGVRIKPQLPKGIKIHF